MSIMPKTESWQDGAVPRDDLFRSAMRDLAAGVSIITVGEGEERTGMTATSLTSLSVDPPSILVCVNRSSSTWPALESHRHFGVNVLRASHQPIAERFAGKGGAKGSSRYADAEWTTLVTGAPILADALAALDCDVEETLERYSHMIVVGRVRAVRLGEDEEALTYWRGAFHKTGIIHRRETIPSLPRSYR
jgi:flavin reductase (DIM6/NTAB) family NADH-FMN oxidoreductase RutF